MVAHNLTSGLRHISIQACSERPESLQGSWTLAMLQHLTNRVASLLVIIRKGIHSAVEGLLIDIYSNGTDDQMSVVRQGAKSFMESSYDEMHNLAGTRSRNRPENLLDGR